jgi:hypothetical protein
MKKISSLTKTKFAQTKAVLSQVKREYKQWPEKSKKGFKAFAICASVLVVPVTVGAIVSSFSPRVETPAPTQQVQVPVETYRCVLEENWFVYVGSKTQCEIKQKEHLNLKNAEFNVNDFAQDYKNALDNLEAKTRK